ncbi:putative prolyl endopeptidase [Sphingobium sp. SYK-6]|uniref:prolyl oligopeptidase family serine peptidase n=1 Tax=Sphingobium sp. (strain NBRC 103272 / SYK-6) TaxID=627192 RepID=UPI000227706C|nr:prolyl oligopeptidase family serine peptidase [Sphingobium sp. SYK-6]BAK66325.1 putative prolyl endopeptidase [Sphingobium sp. SYK-6]
MTNSLSIGVVRSAFAAILLTGTAGTALLAQTSETEDPFLWLEEIEGPRAIAQVEAWNAETDRLLRATPTFESDRARARAILDDEAQIATPDRIMGDRVVNLWRDAKNPRGIWRSSPLDAYVAGKPVWTTLIDVDALGKAEGQSWVWHGADCLAPAYKRCLVSLSPGGTDADVVREWDMETRSFVKNGFTLPEAKSNIAWVDADTLLVGTDYGAGSMTDSGYARIVKEWKRGTPLSAARTVLEGQKQDVSMSAGAAMDGDRRWVFGYRAKDFYTSDMLLRRADGRFVPMPIPDSADMRGIIGGRAVVFLNRPLGDIPAGSLVAWSLADIEAGRETKPELIFTPTAAQAVQDVETTDNLVWISLLDDVQGRLLALTRDAKTGRWASRAVPLAENATVHLLNGAGKRDLAFVTVEGMLQPPTLMAVPASGAPVRVQSLPDRFDASQFTVEQRFATSKDGTRVPYFLVRKKGTSGPVPALIHAYGGFRAAQLPGYLTGQPYRAGPLGLFWVEDGNAYVLANIRGGGEYGPAWHDAALREKRQNSFDDLHAVAEDLVKAGISPKGKIGISGRSNGGVLVGAALTQRPDLYGAVISGSPLHDMKRYSKLLAGASWMAEYGDPDKPEDWAFIKLYSPYQNVKRGVTYPPTFFYLSTKDDRVHPGHARKLAARLRDYGNTVYYHEYREGGHSVGADHAEDAIRAAMLHAFLKRELMGEGQ